MRAGNSITKSTSTAICCLTLQNHDEVITTVEERGTKARYCIRSRHVIGCDGAKSEVRKSLGIECEGEDSCKSIVGTASTRF